MHNPLMNIFLVYKFSQTPLWKEIVEDGKEKIFKVLAGSLSGVAFGNAFYPRNLRAEGGPGLTGTGDELLGVLVDTTLCIGCRSCEKRLYGNK